MQRIINNLQVSCPHISSPTHNYISSHSRNIETRWSFTGEWSFSAAIVPISPYVLPDATAPIRGCGTARRLGRCHESGSTM